MTPRGQSRPPSPCLSLLPAAGAFYAAESLHTYGHSDGLALLAASAAAAFGISRTIRALNAWDQVRDERRLKKQFARFSEAHGQAKWGTLKDAREAGLCNRYGIELGALDGRALTYSGENSLAIVAPPGHAKGTAFVIPNALTWRASKDWIGSIVFVDPTGEIAAISARQQSTLRRVVFQCPFARRMRQQLGFDFQNTPANPLALLKRGSRDAKAYAEMIAEFLIPSNSKDQMSGDGEYFRQFGREILTAFMLDILWWTGRVTLPELRHRLMVSGDRLKDSLIQLAINEGYGGAVREYAEKLLGTFENSAEEFSGGMSCAQQAVAIYDSFGDLGEHVSGDAFDPSTLKEIPTALYLILPPDLIRSHGAWLNLALSTTIEMVGRDCSNRRVLFVVDEAANIGYVPNLLHAMAVYRKFGIQICTIWQQFSQAARIYGQDRARELWGMCDVIAAFGIRELVDLKMLSELIGEETYADGVQNLQPGMQSERSEYSYSGSYRSRPVARPDEIRRIPDGKMLVLHRNSRPFLCDKSSYLKDRRLRRLADPNPYYTRTNRDVPKEVESALPAALPYCPSPEELEERSGGDLDGGSDG
jgi:type IV secretion system protein VirD4